jgi:hypothetical protein
MKQRIELKARIAEMTYALALCMANTNRSVRVTSKRPTQHMRSAHCNAFSLPYTLTDGMKCDIPKIK